MATIRRTQILTDETQRIAHAARRQQEFAREDLLRQVHKDRMTVANASSDERVMNMRRTRVMAAEQQQRDMVASIQAESDRRHALAQKTARDAAVAEELQKLRDLSVRDERMRQQLCETEPEIRELKAKLDAGYVKKEVLGQIAGRQALIAETSRLKDETGRMLQTQRMEWEKEEVDAARDKFVKTQVYQQDLEAQLAEEEARKVAAYEQFMKDKKMIDEIVQRIHAEDAAFAADAHAKKARTQAEFREFQQMQEEHDRQRQAEMAAENAKLAAQAAEIEARAAAELALKGKKAEAREELQKTLGAEMAATEAARREDEDLRILLSEQEQLDRLEAEEQEEIDKKIRRRIEMMKDHDEAVFIKQVRQEQELKEEVAFREAMLEKFARDDKLEQMSAQRRRMKGLEHGREVQKLIEERRARIQIERDREEAEMARAAAAGEARRILIEEERQKLLREHAIKLLGYLPKGVIRDKAELRTLGPQFETTYAPSGGAAYP